MKLSPKYYAQAWQSSLAESQPSDWKAISRRYLQHVYHHGHIKWLPEILRLVARLQHEQAGTVAVTVRTAHHFDVKVLQELVATVLPSTKAVIESQVDERLIGGAQIETSNQRWDLSVKGQLNQLAHTLSN